MLQINTKSQGGKSNLVAFMASQDRVRYDNKVMDGKKGRTMQKMEIKITGRNPTILRDCIEYI
jgi:hypothetical protein